MSDDQAMKTNNDKHKSSQAQSTSSQSKVAHTQSPEGANMGQDVGGQLEHFVSYLKENWKPILTELVAVGVTAYLTHDAKTKSSKRVN